MNFLNILLAKPLQKRTKKQYLKPEKPQSVKTFRGVRLGKI